MKLQQVLMEMPAGAEETSTSQVAAGLKVITDLAGLQPGDINLDIGGGKFDKGSNWLLDNEEVINLVYDPFARSTEHNRDVLQQVRKNGGADSVTILNVLNTIPDRDERLNIIEDAFKYLKPGGIMLVGVYERDGNGKTVELNNKKKTWYQLNQKKKFYMDELEEAGYKITNYKTFFIVGK